MSERRDDGEPHQLTTGDRVATTPAASGRRAARPPAGAPAPAPASPEAGPGHASDGPDGTAQDGAAPPSGPRPPAARHARPPGGRRRPLLLALGLVALLLVVLGVVQGTRGGDDAATPTPTAPVTVGPGTDGPGSDGPGLTRADWDGTEVGVFRQTQPAEVTAYEEFLGAPVDLAVDYSARDTWADVSSSLYLLEEWRDAPQQLVLGVAMLPTEGDDTIERGAAGEYDRYYTTLAEHLVAYGQQDAVLRIGWEFNLAGSRWASDDPQAWIAYFRRIVAAVRAVEGQEFVIDWTVNNGDGNAYDASLYYPGDDVVDYVGVDAYDVSGKPDTYPIPEGCTDACALDRQQRAWSDQVYGGDRGLAFWSSFAADHDKQLSLPEWGLWDRFDGTGGQDDPYYVEQMAAFIADPQNAVGYQAYFEYDGEQGEHRLMVNFPRSREVYLELFGG